ncbi:MAG TPA: threonine synthase [Acidobacteriaceae bacterium]|nr:threonine synthase [Acidobacteriaceae bacterium]
MFSLGALRDRGPTLWRYREALGIEQDENVVSLGEGNTPLLASRLNETEVMLKVDYLCPTGSYKDRGSTVMISKLKEWGVREIIEDSSGNAGASIAAYGALAGIRAKIYVPSSTSAGKAAQIEMYGADLIRVPGSRENTTDAALKAAQNVFYASHNWSPYFLAGMKTAAYEIAEQLDWNVPEWVVTPAGGGSLLAGLYLGFSDMFRAGYTQAIPRLAAVQSDACDPIYRAWSTGLRNIPEGKKKPTAAEGISVARPVREALILDAVRQSKGLVYTVGDDEVWKTVELLGRQGIYVEPTAAAAPAAIQQLRSDGSIGTGDRVVVLLTGSGLKATDKIVEHYASRELLQA